MTDVVRSQIAADLADLAGEGQIVPAPVAPLGYGRDLAGVLGVYDDLRETDPNSADGILELAARRLITPRGTMPGDPDYGYDVRSLQFMGATRQALLEAQQRCELEVRKDSDLVRACTVILKVDQTTLTVYVKIEPQDPAVVVPVLVLAVTDGEVLFRKVNS